MSEDGFVEVWIDDLGRLCFFDDNSNVLVVENWKRLAYLLIHELAAIELPCHGNYLCEPEAIYGGFQKEPKE